MSIAATRVPYQLTVYDFFMLFYSGLTNGAPAYEMEGNAKKHYRLPVVKSIQVTPDTSSKKIYASGAVYDVAQRTRGANATLGLLSLPRAVVDKALGSVSSGSVSYDTTSDGTSAQEFSCGYYCENSDGSLVYYYHPRCRLVPTAQNYNDIGDSDPDPNESYTVEIMPTSEGVWRVRYYTRDVPTGKVALTVDEFFEASPYTIDDIEGLSDLEQAAPAGD